MKNTIRIAGEVLLLALLVSIWGGTGKASAQGPAGYPTASPLIPPANTNPTAVPSNPNPTPVPSNPNPTPVPSNPPSASPTAPASAACTNVATFVADVTMPDHTAVAAGQAFVKTWRLRNRGTCTWGPGYSFTFVSGRAMTTSNSAAVPTTPPEATADFSIPMTAPTTNGAVQGFWQLRAPNGAVFGPRVWALVNVGSLPAAAPPFVPGNPGMDDPARAFTFGSPIASLPPSSAEWLAFAYDNQANALPRPTVTVQLLNGAANGLDFEIYSPETMVDGWSNNKPVGRGNPEVIGNCDIGGQNVGNCDTANLTWTGGFGLSGTYYVRVINNTGNTLSPQIIIGGPGLANCAPAGAVNTAVNNQGKPFSEITCTSPLPGAPIPPP